MPHEANEYLEIDIGDEDSGRSTVFEWFNHFKMYEIIHKFI
jgi:hypothetical protein